MTDTETPIQAGARALHEKTYAGLDIGPWDTRSARGRERFLTDARAVFGSVDVEGLADALHRCDPSFSGDPGTYDRLAEAVVAWLTGGGA